MFDLQKLLSTVTNRLVLINIVAFFITKAVFAYSLTGLELFSWHTANFRWYQLLSHMFLHGSEMHLAFNMLALWMFGRIIEQAIGAQRFLIFYLGCGVGAAVLSQLIDQYLLNQVYMGAMVGASGAIYGLLVAFALMFPNFKVALIFLPIPIAAKYFVPVLILIDVIGGFTGYSLFGQNIAHFAHVGGAIMGFVLIQVFKAQAQRR